MGKTQVIFIGRYQKMNADDIFEEIIIELEKELENSKHEE